MVHGIRDVCIVSLLVERGRRGGNEQGGASEVPALGRRTSMML